MKKVSDVFKSIRFAKGEPRGKKHLSTDDEEHGTVGEMDFDQQLAHAKKRAMQEAKDPGEYDQEGDMAMTQLRSIIYHAQELHDQLDQNDNLPEWVQSKITLAQDYMQTACDYMYSQKNEEVVAESSLNELSKDTLKSYAKKAVPDMQASQTKSEIEAGKAASTKDDKTAKTHYDAAKQAKDRTEKRMAGISGAIKRVTNQGVAEEVVQEKRGLWDNIHAKRERIKNGSGERMRKPGSEGAPSAEDLRNSRVKEEVELQEEKQQHTHVTSQDLDFSGHGATHIVKKGSHMRYVEGSKQMYIHLKNGKPVQKTHPILNIPHEFLKRVNEEVEQLEEGRQSQRHPLEGHEYHKKSDEALVHIAKDAHAAAEAMKSHNTDAENKYRDQANDSATVRHYRKTHGMADWYKKKYGHIKEEVVDEEVKDEYARKVDKYLKKKHGKDDSQKKLPQGASFAAARRKARLASNGRMDEALSPAIRMQMALQKAKEDRERSERNGESALAGKFSSGPAKPVTKNPSLVSPKNEEVIVEDNVINKEPKLPFDEPTTKARGTVKDKSGAEHTSMSRVKDLAKKAARKQAGIKEAADINDPLDKIDTEAKRSLSRTAGMVKDLATNAKAKAKSKDKKDAFEPEPEISSQIMKQD